MNLKAAAPGSAGEHLLTLRPGQTGTVLALELPPQTAAALRRLGLTLGTELRCLRCCPLGGPGLYLVRGAVLALRRQEAAHIAVRSSWSLPNVPAGIKKAPNFER